MKITEDMQFFITVTIPKSLDDDKETEKEYKELVKENKKHKRTQVSYETFRNDKVIMASAINNLSKDHDGIREENIYIKFAREVHTPKTIYTYHIINKTFVFAPVNIWEVEVIYTK